MLKQQKLHIPATVCNSNVFLCFLVSPLILKFNNKSNTLNRVTESQQTGKPVLNISLFWLKISHNSANVFNISKMKIEISI